MLVIPYYYDCGKSVFGGMGLFILVPGWRSRGFRRCGDDGQGHTGAIKQLHFVVCVCLLRLDALYVFFVVHVWFGIELGWIAIKADGSVCEVADNIFAFFG